MDFQAYGRPLVAVAEFKYLGKFLTVSDDNWPALVGNVRNASKQWAQMSRIIGQELMDPQTSGNFYKGVVQATILFGAESWVMSPRIGRALGGFQCRLARRM